MPRLEARRLVHESQVIFAQQQHPILSSETPSGTAKTPRLGRISVCRNVKSRKIGAFYGDNPGRLR